jgi:hypothetical protein
MYPENYYVATKQVCRYTPLAVVCDEIVKLCKIDIEMILEAIKNADGELDGSETNK